MAQSTTVVFPVPGGPVTIFNFCGPFTKLLIVLTCSEVNSNLLSGFE